MLYGSYSYEFAILLFNGNWRNENLHKRALEYSIQVPTIESIPNKGKPGNSINTFSIDSEDDVLLTGLYPQKNMIVTRFFKSNDQISITPISFEKKGAIMVETNLDGKPIRSIDGKIDFKSREIKTIQIQLK